MEKSTASRVLLTLFRILFTLFVLWTILFIFRNSLESGVLSSARSQAVTAAVNQHLGRVGLSPSPTPWCASWPTSENICCWASGTPCACGCTPAATSATSAGPCCWASWWPTWTRPCNAMWPAAPAVFGTCGSTSPAAAAGVAAALCALVLIGGLLSLAGFGRKG